MQIRHASLLPFPRAGTHSRRIAPNTHLSTPTMRSPLAICSRTRWKPMPFSSIEGRLIAPLLSASKMSGSPAKCTRPKRNMTTQTTASMFATIFRVFVPSVGVVVGIAGLLSSGVIFNPPSILLLRFSSIRQRLNILPRQHLVRPPLRTLGVNPDVAIADFERRADGGCKLGWAEIVLREIGHVPVLLLVVHPEAEARLHLGLVFLRRCGPVQSLLRDRLVSLLELLALLVRVGELVGVHEGRLLGASIQHTVEEISEQTIRSR